MAYDTAEAPLFRGKYGRARTALRLQRDLEINLPGVALALELLEELDRLRRELAAGSP